MKLLRKLSKKLNISVWLLLGLLVASVLFLLGRNLSKVKVKGAPPLLRQHLNSYAKLLGYGDSVVEYILAMSALESGRWTSDIYYYRNNPWGMKFAKVRPNSQVRSYYKEGDFAWYANYEMAAKDIFLWLEYGGSPDYFWSLKDFVFFLQSKGYEGDLSANEYYTRIKNAIA